MMPSAPVCFRHMEIDLPAPTWLSQLNEHVRDRRLTFFADTHSYYIDGVQTLGSVTGLIHCFCEEFIESRVISRMMNGQRWPRPGYLRIPYPADAMAALQLHDCCKSLYALLEADAVPEHEVCAEIKHILTEHPEHAELLAAFSKSSDEIIALWQDNREEAAHRGTWMHYQMECWLNRVPVDPSDAPELQMLVNYTRTLTGLTAYRTEWAIFAEEENLAGSIDFVAINDSAQLVLFDWKRSRDLRSKYTSSFGHMLEPLNHIEDCAGWHYRLQLNIYKYVLQKYYGMVVAQMFVVCAHPDNGNTAFVDQVGDNYSAYNIGRKYTHSCSFI